MESDNGLYKHQIISIAEDRGFTPKQIAQFFNLYGDQQKGYTVEMLDTFEYSVNGPVIGSLHPNTKNVI